MVKPTTTTTNSGSDERRSENYTGVRKRKWGKYVSEIRLPNSRERIWLGSYDTPEKAARAFDAASYCLRGRKANFNFPNTTTKLADMLCGSDLTPTEIQNFAAKFANEENHDQQEEEQEVISSTVVPSCTDDHSFSSNTTTTTTTTTTPIANVELSSEVSSSYAASYSSPSVTDTDNNVCNPSMDWSFLELLNTQPQSADNGMASTGYYYGSSTLDDDIHIEYLLPPLEIDSYAGDEMSTNQYHQQSFLWNF